MVNGFQPLRIFVKKPHHRCLTNSKYRSLTKLFFSFNCPALPNAFANITSHDVVLQKEEQFYQKLMPPLLYLKMIG